MNQKIKVLTKEYLESIWGLSAKEKEKIINFNDNSEWVVFSGQSLKEIKNLSALGLREGQGYRGIVRANENGYLLEDLVDFPETLHQVAKNRLLRGKNRELIAAHSSRSGPPIFEYFHKESNNFYKLGGIKEVDWKLDEDGYVKFRDKDGWFYKSYVVNENVSNKDFQGSDQLIIFLEEIWKEILKQKGVDINQNLIDDSSFYDLSGISFFTNQVPLTKKNSGYLHAVYYPIFTRGQKNEWWVAIKKNFFAEQTESILSQILTLQSPESYKAFKDLNILDSQQTFFASSPVARPLIYSNEEINLEIGKGIWSAIKKVIEVFEENQEIVQRGRNLGLNLEEIAESEGQRFEDSINWSFSWTHSNNNRAREILKSIFITYQANQEKLHEEEKRREEIKNNLEQVRSSSILFIKQLLKQEPEVDSSELSENNRDWESQITRSSSFVKIEILKEKLWIDINKKRKEKLAANLLEELVKAANKLENPAQLKIKLEEIEKHRGNKKYKELTKQIEFLWKKLTRLNPSSYRDDSFQQILKVLKNNNLEEKDLISEIQIKLNELKSQTRLDFQRVNQIRAEVIDSILKQAASKKLYSLINEIGKSDNDSNKKKILKRKLLNFISEDNDFQLYAYQEYKSEVDQLLKVANEQPKEKREKDLSSFLLPFFLFSFLITLIIVSALKLAKSKRR